MKRTILLALFLVFALGALASCGQATATKQPVYFMSDGAVHATVSTAGAEMITLPSEPIKEGYTFEGWYRDEGTWQRPFTESSLLGESLSSPMSVYAKWTKNAEEPAPDPTPNPDPTPDPTPEPEPEITEPTIVVSSAEAIVGVSNVEITVALKNNPGITSMLISIGFDNSALELVSMKYNSEMGGTSVPNASKKSPVIAYWADNFTNISEDLVFVTLQFKVLRSAAPGDYEISVSYDKNDVFNANERNVSFDVINGKITVSGN